MTKNKYKLTLPLEPYTRKIIEDKLKLLSYELDEMKESCNVYRERAKYRYQEDKLNGKNPDFLIYKTDSSEILAVIEAKRPGL